ncbi:MAG: hypothetical protein M0P71_00680 [Melioribacteraceae bacterium]|nr:hypothetical protein [Melioribacteraceae bacterium]
MRETRHDTAVFSVQVFKNDRLIKITTEPYEIVSNDKKAESINFEIVCMDRFCEIIRNKEKHGIN